MPNPAIPLFAGNFLACRRGERLVFTDLSFVLARGEALLLQGPNGSGKSSLLRLLSGLGRAESGVLTWGGAPVANDPAAHRSRSCFIGHLDAIKPTLTVQETLGFWAGMRGARERVPEALADFGLARLASFPCRFLSAGERKRLSLARLLTAPAELWLLDEPTSSLDAAGESDLLRALAAHRARGGRVVLATHATLDLPGAKAIFLPDFAPQSGRRRAA
jgi:heme exporter protein A